MDAFERTVAALQLLGLGRWPRLISEYLLTPRSKEPSRLSADSRDESIATLQSAIPGKWPRTTLPSSRLISDLPVPDLEPVTSKFAHDSSNDPFPAHAAGNPENIYGGGDRKVENFIWNSSCIPNRPEDVKSTDSLTPIARSHNFIPPDFPSIDHIVVVLRDDVDARRLPRVPPPEFRFMYVPDSRVSFVLVFSEAEFQLWKLTPEFPTLYPYESSGTDFSGEKEDVQKAENEKKKQDISKTFDVKYPSASLAEPDIPVNTPLQTATQRAYQVFRRITLQQVLLQTESQDGIGNGNGTGLGQDHAGDNITTEGDTNTNNPVVDESEGVDDPPPVSNADLNLEGKLPFKPFAYPKSKVVRRFIFKRLVNGTRRSRRVGREMD
ncbi:unnamed protein product [Penicillium pancosmium]